MTISSNPPKALSYAAACARRTLVALFKMPELYFEDSRLDAVHAAFQPIMVW